MADQEHLEILKRGVKAWNKWRIDNCEITPDVTDAELSRAILPGVNLSHAHVSGANLSRSDLRRANLSGAYFSGANLNDANLNDAILNCADFSRTKLSEAKLNSATLGDADLSEANFNRADLSNADLNDAILIGANLSGSVLIGANLSNTNLSRAILSDAVLIGANLSQAVLIDAVLTGANLSQAVLSHADLSRVDLTEAILNRADLKGATLNHSDFSHANLIEANLSSANLSRTNLSSADLHDSNLANAVIRETLFTGNDLSTVKCLETARHFGPSEISANTLSKSKGNIPEKFLRGCGLQDWEIENVKLYHFDLSLRRATDILYKVVELRTNPALMFHSCFMSYSHADKSFARRLHDQLQARGIRCWLDEHQLLPGHDIYDEVDRGIRLWDKVLLCCSKDSLSSWWVDKEISTAFDKEQTLWKERNKKTLALIPLNLDGYLFSGQWQDGKAIPIKTRLAADFTGWESDNAKFDREFERLVKALRADGGDREAPPTPKL